MDLHPVIDRCIRGDDDAFRRYRGPVLNFNGGMFAAVDAFDMRSSVNSAALAFDRLGDSSRYLTG